MPIKLLPLNYHINYHSHYYSLYQKRLVYFILPTVYVYILFYIYILYTISFSYSICFSLCICTKGASLNLIINVHSDNKRHSIPIFKHSLNGYSPCFCLHSNMCGYPTKHQLQQEAVNSGLNALFSPHPRRRFDNTSRKGGRTGLLGSRKRVRMPRLF